MSENPAKVHSGKLRAYFKPIRSILLKDWDPIGIADEPCAQDEYDGYVPGLYKLLVSGASQSAIAQHLYEIELKWMGGGPYSRSAEAADNRDRAAGRLHKLAAEIVRGEKRG